MNSGCCWSHVSVSIHLYDFNTCGEGRDSGTDLVLVYKTKHSALASCSTVHVVAEPPIKQLDWFTQNRAIDLAQKRTHDNVFVVDA